MVQLNNFPVNIIVVTALLLRHSVIIMGNKLVSVMVLVKSLGLLEKDYQQHTQALLKDEYTHIFLYKIISEKIF